MKALKNFEAMFVVAVALACSASYASFMQPQPQAQQTASASQTGMHVVTVSAKRMTAQEKQLSLLEERQELLRNATASTL